MAENVSGDNSGCERNLWAPAKTKLLIESFMERASKFRDPKIKKKNLWIEIKNAMSSAGYADVTEDGLDRKMRNLKKTYRTIKDNNQQTGRGAISWPYYQLFEEIFRDDRTINPDFTISSLSFENTGHIVITSDSAPPSPRSPLAPLSPMMFPSVESQRFDESPTLSPSHERNTSKSLLYRQRKEMIDLEKKRVAILEDIKTKIHASNEIQKDRNDILKKNVRKNVIFLLNEK